MGTVIRIPYAPRPLQRVIHDGMDQYRFGAVVCHRRFGKTVCAVNHLQRAAMEATMPRPRFAYIAPTYKQGKAIAWDYVKHYARPVADLTVNESELRIDFATNGAQVRIYGADNPDSLRGIYLDGVVLDEYGLMPPTLWGEVIRPLLVDRQGWALFMGTPAGKNQFYDVIKEARAAEDWFFAEYKASQTGLIPEVELELAKRTMSADEYLQEFECSFEASVKGAVYAREILSAREQGRITRVPYDPTLRVETDWDLGIGDATAIWFSQSTPGGEVRLIDYYEASGQNLAHFVKILSEKPYAYGEHWAPHDIQVRELGTGRSRLEAAQSLGLHFNVCPRVDKLEDGIHAARMLFGRCWFDAERCAQGVEALQHYRWAPPTTNPTSAPKPVHDFASHGADAFRGLAYRWYQPKRHTERESGKELRRLQRDHDSYDARRRPVAIGRGGY
jgi:phage terminase large subunit